jgi:hypothetical protein
MGRVLAAAGLIALLATGLWAWSRGVTGPYHFDDYATPIGDPASQSLSAWRQHLPVTLRPLTKLTYALEADAGSSEAPGARRVVSIVLHSVSAGLLMLLIRRFAPGTAPLGAAFLAATWFVHPVHADSILLVSGRTAALSNLFLIAALLALDRSRQWLSALLFALACLSRETALVALLPLAVLVTGRHRGRGPVILRELAPLLATGALVLCWILTTPRYLQLAEFSMLGRPFWSSVTKQVGAVPIGLGLLFHPAALSIDYGIPLPVKVTEPFFLLGLLLYLAAATGIFMLHRRAPAVAVGLALWLAALLPTQSVVPKLDALSNRPLSLALAGLLVAAAPLVGAALSRGRDTLGASASREGRRRWPRVAASSVAIALFASLVVQTSHRGKLFQSPLKLWQDAAAKSRVNERPHMQYAVLLLEEGRYREAREALSTAQRINPFSSQIATMSRLFQSREVSR